MKNNKFIWLLPLYYPYWLLIALLYLVSKINRKLQSGLGFLIGYLLYIFSKKIKRTIKINIELCMPNLKNDEKALLVKNICIRYGHSLIEIALAWFATNNQINDLFIIEGEEHLEIAKKTARPIILGTAHFSCLELGLAKASMLFKSYAGLYRPSKNDLIEYIMYRARMKRGCFMIPHTNIKDLIKKLKEGFSTVYLPDQPDLNSGTNLIPFFDNPCITNLALSKIARISGAIILPMCMRFDKKKNSYVLSFSPHYEPSNDERFDTKHLINIFENYIKSCPEQYLWSYKKFKGRPLCFKQYY